MLPDDLAELRAELDAAVTQRELQQFRGAIHQAAEPCVLLFPTADPLELDGPRRAALPEHWPGFGEHATDDFNRLVMDHLPLGASRLGGLPDLPPGTEWPTCAGAKLPLVAQIDLSAVPRWSDCPLPHTGWLCVFFAFEAGLDREPCVVLHVDVPREYLRRAAWPAEGEVHRDWGDIAVYDAVPLAPRLSLSGDFADLADADDFDVVDALLELESDFYESSYLDGRQPAVELLGTVTFPDTSAAREARDAGRSEADWINLIEVQSAGTMMWSDAGKLNVLIRASALRAGDFGDVISAVNSS